jgi:hypothetical protein
LQPVAGYAGRWEPVGVEVTTAAGAFLNAGSGGDVIPVAGASFGGDGGQARALASGVLGLAGFTDVMHPVAVAGVVAEVGEGFALFAGAAIPAGFPGVE